MEYIGKTKKEGRDITVYSGHLAAVGNKKRFKRILYISSIVIIVLGVLIFPYQVGSVIGYWVSEFVNGLKSHF